MSAYCVPSVVPGAKNIAIKKMNLKQIRCELCSYLGNSAPGSTTCKCQVTEAWKPSEAGVKQAKGEINKGSDARKAGVQVLSRPLK